MTQVRGGEPTKAGDVVRSIIERFEQQKANGVTRPIETEEEIAQKNAERAAREAEIDRVNWLSRFYQNTSNHGLPLNADLATLDKLDISGADKEAFELLKAWKPSDQFGFLVAGPAGCGKSFALQAIAKSIMFDDLAFSKYRRSLRWFPVTGSLDQIRREMAIDFDGLKQSALTAHYLFIDDIGAENLTEWSREQIYQIIEHRLNYGLTTFISTNCSIKELQERYHERFVSRLKETMVVLQLQGKDRRSETMKNNIQLLKSRMKGSV